MATSSRALYPGSFDPFTRGHLDIAQRAVRLFGRVTILVAETLNKQTIFSIEDRVRLIKESTRGLTGIQVVGWDGLVVDYAKKHHIPLIVRGLRAGADFEPEFSMAKINRDLAPNVETVFLVTSDHLSFVSSSMIKELLRFGGNASRYLPPPVAKALGRRS